MDNGHRDAKDAIFSNNPDLDDNLNEETWQRSLEISKPSDLPSPDTMKARGDAILSSNNPAENLAEDSAEAKGPKTENIPTEYTPVTPIQTIFPLEEKMPELGEITDVSAAVQSSLDHTYNPANIKTTGDRLDPASIVEVDHAIDELNHTGDLNTFYDKARTMTDANTLNSFDRVLYNDGGNG